jgi:hypothetical protein
MTTPSSRARTEDGAAVGAEFVATPATEADVRCIEERQLGHKVTCVGSSRKPCKHGYPQSFVYHPSLVSVCYER